MARGFHRVGATLPVACMPKSVRLPKVIAMLVAEKASSYARFDKTVIGKV